MQNKSILITGCSSGIGYDAARTFAARGWQVFATCRQQQDCDRLCLEGLESFVLDYEDPATIGPALERILDTTGGRLDVLFNNGAYAIPAPLEDVPPEALQTIFQANVIGWHDLTRRVVPVMRSQGGGRIINNSSVLGLVGMKWRGAYVATKFALEGMSDVLRMELGESNIQVILIEPGPIDTEFRNNAIRQFEKWIDWQASPLADAYRDSLLDKLYKGSSSGPQWPVSAVTKKLIHAAEARNPKARYFVTTPTYVMAISRRLVPTSVLDWFLKKA